MITDRAFFTPTDRAYFLERAEAAMRMAEKAEDANAVQAHCRLADLYLNEAYGDGAGGSVTSAQVRSQIGRGPLSRDR